MKEQYYCPVCGYDKLDDPPINHNVCSCCGTHFGYHDVGHTWLELREDWLLKGAPWFSRAVAPPIGWNALKQLNKLSDMENIRLTASKGTTRVEIGGRKPSLAA